MPQIVRPRKSSELTIHVRDDARGTGQKENNGLPCIACMAHKVYVGEIAGLHNLKLAVGLTAEIYIVFHLGGFSGGFFLYIFF